MIAKVIICNFGKKTSSGSTKCTFRLLDVKRWSRTRLNNSEHATAASSSYKGAYDNNFTTFWHSQDRESPWFKVKFYKERIVCFVKIRRRHEPIALDRYKSMKVILYRNTEAFQTWETSENNGAPYNLESGKGIEKNFIKCRPLKEQLD